MVSWIFIFLIFHFLSFWFLVSALHGLSLILRADVLGDTSSLLGVAGRDVAAAGSLREPHPPCKGSHTHTIQQVSDVTTVPNETEREKTNSQCRLWGGPTVSGSSVQEVKGGTGNSAVITLSSLGRERACPVEG